MSAVLVIADGLNNPFSGLPHGVRVHGKREKEVH